MKSKAIASAALIALALGSYGAATASQPAAVPAAAPAAAQNGAINSNYEVVREQAELPGYTVYRPSDAPKGAKFPVVIYGNGGCQTNNQEARPFLTNVAKHGFVVIAVGDADAFNPNAGQIIKRPEGEPAPPPPPVPPHLSTVLIDAIDWVDGAKNVEQLRNADPKRLGVMGQSCGGIQALRASPDPRVDSVAAWNSSTGRGVADQEVLQSLRTPTLWVPGGPDDTAYTAAVADYAAVPDSVPSVIASNAYAGHVLLFGFNVEFIGFEPGELPPWPQAPGINDPGRNMEAEAVELAVNWLDRTLSGNKKAGDFFLGEDSTLGKLAAEGWTVESKNWKN